MLDAILLSKSTFSLTIHSSHLKGAILMKMLHPNITEHGKVQLKILQTHWTTGVYQLQYQRFAFYVMHLFSLRLFMTQDSS